jgi:threonine dehydrogenase-like Zn-dependent dehydrogenase
MLDPGGKVMLFAVRHPSTPPNLDPNLLHQKEFTVLGTTGKDPNDLRIAGKLPSLGMIDVTPAIEAVIPFRETVKALDPPAAAGSYRVLLAME